MRQLYRLIVVAIPVTGVLACAPASVVVGTGAVVARSVVQERSTFDALQDTEIGLSLNNGLANHSGELFRDVSVDVIEGRVLLTGTVPEREDKIAATGIAWQTKGVVAVEDRLVVAEDTGTEAYWTDVWISNQIRYALLTDRDIRSVNFNVETVDRVVHVTGIARSPSEIDAVLKHASTTADVARVISHILTIDDPRRLDAAAPTG
ncbi:MAG: BON domain-containing protein [Pseudomonadota bacterium]